MDQIAIKDTKELLDRIEATKKVINFEKLKQELADLHKSTMDADLWKDAENAKKVLQKTTSLEKEINAWEELQGKAKRLIEKEALAKDLAGEHESIESELKNLSHEFLLLETKAFLGGTYDRNSAIVSLHSGTGGVDACDWAEMLLRMYLRYAEKKDWATKITHISSARDAGIKSAELEVEGDWAYGFLKEEAGVHRLVRLSPFNAQNLRQTSFALVEVLPLIEENEKVKIDAKDLRIDVFRASGHGGQSVNTTDSAVRIVHLPTGLTVSCQSERSQHQNKERALKILYSRLTALSNTQREEEKAILRGEYAGVSWGRQIRSYVLNPYKMVKDLRSGFETSDVNKILDGDLDEIIDSNLRKIKS